MERSKSSFLFDNKEICHEGLTYVLEFATILLRILSNFVEIGIKVFSGKYNNREGIW